MGVVQTSIASYNPGIADMSPPMTFRVKSNFFWKLKFSQMIKYITWCIRLNVFVICRNMAWQVFQACLKKCERMKLHVAVLDHIEEKGVMRRKEGLFP